METVEARVGQLRDAVWAAREIGLTAEASAAEAVAERIAKRAGFGGSTYVLALAGGTGVGKSSLLNALAGVEVSQVGPTRPTTDQPVALVAEKRRDQLGALLKWLRVREVVAHESPGLDGVAIIDLPDVDSTRVRHRARVDGLLPRIDAITWVIDPEKYDDERIHSYWRTLVPHADRMRFVLNKADRLGEEEQLIVARDLRRRLREDGIAEPAISVVSSITGQGIDRLRDDLTRAADAKAVVSAKLDTDLRTALADLAHAVGIDPRVGYATLLPQWRVTAAIREAVEGAMAVVDPVGLARHVHGAVMNRARIRGGSLLGRLIMLLGALTGQRHRSADPARYLTSWRQRGSLGKVLNPLRALVVEAVSAVPSASRPTLFKVLRADEAEAIVERAMDEATRHQAERLRVPASILWPVIGVGQVLAGAVFLFAIAWYMTLFLAGGQVPVSTAELPILGSIPMPLALLTGSVVLSGFLGWVLGTHARFVGRREAARVVRGLRPVVRDVIHRVVLDDLNRLEDARRRIAVAAAWPRSASVSRHLRR